MGKKAGQKHNSIWSIPRIFGSHHALFSRLPFSFRTRGFTLIELVVALAILGIIIAITLVKLNPASQIAKARDAQRQHDLEQIRDALDTYYNDNNAYPSCVSFGGTFESSDSFSPYIQSTPQDPLCSNDPSCSKYMYLTDPDNPQWFVLLAKMELINNLSPCKLSCGPVIPNGTVCGYTSVDLSTYNFCVFAGDVPTSTCVVSTEAPIPTVSGTPGPTFTPTPTPTQGPTVTQGPTATPEPLPTLPCSTQFACTGGPPTRCNVVAMGLGRYCGFEGCFGNECCENTCDVE